MTDDETDSIPLEAQGLRKAEKAAIVVRYLLSEGAELRLSDLPEPLQERLAVQMGQMRYIDRRTLAAVITEFARELEGIGLSFPHDLTGALTALDGRISPLTAERLRQEAGAGRGSSPWDRVCDLPLPDLQAIAQRESIEVAAVLLSKLSVQVAANLLASLPGDLARRITLAVGRTSAVSPQAVERIGAALAAQLDDKPVPAFALEPEKRLGAILNMARSEKRSELLEGLTSDDADFASGVRRSIFTFADIPARVQPRDVPTILRALPREGLLTALIAAGGPLEGSREFLLTNLSKRMADGLRDDIADGSSPSEEEGEAAQSELVQEIVALAEAGEIKLIPPVLDGSASGL